MLYRASDLTASPTLAVSKGEKGIAKMDHFDQKSNKNEDNDDDNKDSIDGNVSPVATSTGPKRKFRIIDETQLSEEEARKLELRRAYNRDCASRARTRTKSLVKELQEQVRTLKQEKEELRLSNANLQTCLAFSEKQNRELIAKHASLDGRSFQSSTPGTGDLPLLHPTLLQGMGLRSNNMTAASRLMYDAEQSRQLNLLQQNLLLQQHHEQLQHQQHQNSAASVAVAATNASRLLPEQSPTGLNNMAFSNNQLVLRDQLMNINSAPNSDLLAALVRMRQNENNPG
jgi:hypothetical protein